MRRKVSHRRKRWFTFPTVVWTFVKSPRVHYQWLWRILVSTVKVTKDTRKPSRSSLENVMSEATSGFDCFDRIRAIQFAVICGNRRSYGNVADDDVEFGMKNWRKRWCELSHADMNRQKCFPAEGSFKGFQISRTFQRHLDSFFPPLIARLNKLLRWRNPLN